MNAKLQPPQLKDVLIKAGNGAPWVWVRQVGRASVLVDADGNPVPASTLNEIEAIRYRHFLLRLEDAWREYDEGGE